MATLVPIWGTPSETINSRHAPSIEAAFRELLEASGIMPIVSSGGGSRNLADAIAVGTGAASDHYESNAKGRAAIDLYNQRAFRNWDEPRFESIMARYGWWNITIGGDPFPSEPWHFANHDPDPWQPPPAPPKPKGVPMFTIIRDPATTFVYAVGADGRRTGIQNERQFSALTRLRASIFNTGQDVEEFFTGDFDDPGWGNLRAILDAINGDGEPQETTWKPSDQDLAKIGAAVNVKGLVEQIDRLAEADKIELLAAINKPRTVS